MRIVGGSLKGRNLVAPSGQGTRPTSDRVRESVFNILEHAPWSPGIRGQRVLDLFAGTGALGLEALSRGASHGLFVENDRQAQAALRTNLDNLSQGGVGKVSPRDATSLGKRPHNDDAAFGLVFLDPPYSKGLAEKALVHLAEQKWLSLGAILVLERALDEPAITLPEYEVVDERTYGVARVSFLRFSPPT
jgi:16S rRNA (guanine966-N2)-methyltransferase